MSDNSTQRLHPLVFIGAGVVVFALVGFGVDTLLVTTDLQLASEGPLSGVTTYNFTVLFALAGGVLGGFASYGLI